MIVSPERVPKSGKMHGNFLLQSEHASDCECSLRWNFRENREAPVRFGYGFGMERFKRFRFSVLAVPLQKGFSVFQCILTGKDGSGSGFGAWKTVPAVPVPL